MLNPRKIAAALALSSALAAGTLSVAIPASAVVHPCGVKCKLSPQGRASAELPKPRKIVVPPTYGGRA